VTVRLGLPPSGNLAKEGREPVTHEAEQQGVDQSMGGDDGGETRVGQQRGS
jgi:hypothetical protein